MYLSIYGELKLTRGFQKSLQQTVLLLCEQVADQKIACSDEQKRGDEKNHELQYKTTSKENAYKE